MKQHYTITAEPSDMDRLDAWAKPRKLTRGGALVELLNMATDGRTSAPGDGRMDSPQETQSPNNPIPQLRSPEGKAVSLALAAKVLESEQKRVGVHPTVLDGDELTKVHDPDAAKSDFYDRKDGRMPDFEKKSEPADWDEYDQSGGDR